MPPPDWAPPRPKTPRFILWNLARCLGALGRLGTPVEAPTLEAPWAEWRQSDAARLWLERAAVQLHKLEGARSIFPSVPWERLDALIPPVLVDPWAMERLGSLESLFETALALEGLIRPLLPSEEALEREIMGDESPPRTVHDA